MAEVAVPKMAAGEGEGEGEGERPTVDAAGGAPVDAGRSRASVARIGGGIPAWQLHYLVASFLEQGPCKQSAALLREELAQHGMLPTCGYMGTQTLMSFEDVGRRHARAFGAHGGAGGHLPALLGRLFEHVPRDHSARFETRRTLLGSGRHSLVAPQKLAVEPGAGPATRRARRSKQAGILRWLSGYETRGRRQLTPTSRGFLRNQYSTLFTVLGHFQAVYSAVFDKTGRRMVTASDDKLVKIWDAHNGQLLRTLRGHSGEIIMVAINSANTVIASCDDRGWVRLWRMHDGKPLAVLRAHSSANTELAAEEDSDGGPNKPFFVLHVAFMLHAGVEYILCTTADGLCPIWALEPTISRQDTGQGQSSTAAAVPEPAASVETCCTQYEIVRVGDGTTYADQQESRGAAAAISTAPESLEQPDSGAVEADGAQNGRQLATKCFDINPQQTHMAAGCSDNNIYIYDLFPSPSAAAAKTRHRSRRVGTLSGHTKPVDIIRFAHTQTDEIGRLLSSSEDETVRIWGVTQHAGIVRHHSLGCIDLRPPVVKPIGNAGGARGRARGNSVPSRKSDISCIMWSLDDSRVVTSAVQSNANQNTPPRDRLPTKSCLQVWSAERKPGSRVGNFSSSVGKLLFTLGGPGRGGHVQEGEGVCEVFVLKEHPHDSRLMLSGGYDGRAFLWNVVTGEPLIKLLDSDGTKIIDGAFSEDGTQIVVSDQQGYFSVFGSGPPPVCLKEQFFTKDYDPLTYDQAGWCEDAITQQAPHLLPRQLADSEMAAYPDALQPAFGSSAASVPRFWHASHSLSQGPGKPKECVRWYRYEELPLPDQRPAQPTDPNKPSKSDVMTTSGYEIGTAERDDPHVRRDTTPRRNSLSRPVGAPASSARTASASRNNIRTVADLNQSGSSAANAIPVYREDDGGLSDSGTESEGEAFDGEAEEEEEDDDEEEEEDISEEDLEDDDDEDYDFGTTRRTRARARNNPASRGRSPRQAARTSGARVSTRRRAAAANDLAAGDSDYSDEEVRPTRRSVRPRKRARVTMESDEESEDETAETAAGGEDDDDDSDSDDNFDEDGMFLGEHGWYETQEDDTIQSISAWHGLDEDEMLDMNRRRIRGLSQCTPAIAKKMKLKQGTWLQLSEVVGPGWGDAEDEDVPVVDHAARRRKRAAKARQGAGRAAAASPRKKKTKSPKRKSKKQDEGKSPKQGKSKKQDNSKKQTERSSSNAAGGPSRDEKNPNAIIPRNAYYWLNEHFTFLFRYVPQIDDEVTYVHALHREYDSGSRVRLMTPPYESIRGLRSAEHCKVVGLEYFLATPPTIARSYVKMKLLRLWEEGEKVSRTAPSFDLYYFPIVGAPDFLVLSAWYKKMVTNPWAPGQRVIVPFMEEADDDKDWEITASNYTGEVVEVAEVARPSKFFASKSSTSNMVNSITVRWDTPDEPSQTSPWELIPEDRSSRNRASDDDLVDHHALSRSFALDNDKQKQLSIAIARLEDENLSLFLEDPTVYAGYIEEVPCPMYLNLITTRLEDCYYRTLAHIRHDIGLLLSNFKLYNKGEPFDWVEEVQEMLFECVENVMGDGLASGGGGAADVK